MCPSYRLLARTKGWAGLLLPIKGSSISPLPTPRELRAPHPKEPHDQLSSSRHRPSSKPWRLAAASSTWRQTTRSSSTTACHYSDRVGVAARAVVFLAAALLLHLVAPFRHAAAACGGLYGAYCLLIDRTTRQPRSRSSSSAGPLPRATTRRVMAGCGGAGIVCSK